MCSTVPGCRLCIAVKGLETAAEVPSIRQAIDKVRRTQIQVLKDEHAAKVAKAGGAAAKPRPKDAETGRIVGTFEATYLGMVQGCPVKGQDVVEKSIETVRTPLPPLPVLLLSIHCRHPPIPLPILPSNSSLHLSPSPLFPPLVL